VFLFLWIALVFHAGAHPSVHRHADQAGHEDREAATHEDGAQERRGPSGRADSAPRFAGPVRGSWPADQGCTVLRWPRARPAVPVRCRCVLT
jgi:hypothetical protein